MEIKTDPVNQERKTAGQMTGIVILNYRTWELSLRCMESIRRTCAGMQWRIYLVDNHSPGPVPELVRSRFLAWQPEGSLCLIRAEANRGYAAGNNLGIKRALEEGCDFVLIANSDIVFREHAVQKLKERLAAHPKAGIAGPMVVNEKGEIQPSRCGMHTGMKEIFQVYTVAKKLFFRKWKRYYCLDQDPCCPSYVHYVSGCCFAATRECAQKVFPMDEGTVLYGEELILAIRMEQEGFSTLYEPESVVVHMHGASAKKVRPFMYQCICQSELYYCSRYLNARKWQLWLLFRYRRLLCRIRCIKDKQLRSYWKVFHAQTKKAYAHAKNGSWPCCTGGRENERDGFELEINLSE